MRSMFFARILITLLFARGNQLSLTAAPDNQAAPTAPAKGDALPDNAPNRLKFQSYDGDPKQPEKMEFQINTLDIKQPSLFLKIGDIIPKTHWRLTGFTFKETTEAKPSDRHDISEITIEDTVTKREVTLVIAQPKNVILKQDFAIPPK